MAKESNIPDHCLKYALSDAQDKDYQSLCTSHEHLDICDRCESLSSVSRNIDVALLEIPDKNMSVDTKHELTFIVGEAKRNILAWKAHLLRSINQDEARLDLIEALDETSVFLVQDWAVKFIHRKYRESQRDWYGKRGLSWHITIATRRTSSQQLEMMTFVHIFQACSQDSYAVLAVMSDVIGKLKKIMPLLKNVYYRQDNAGCYRSCVTIVGAARISQIHDISVSAWTSLTRKVGEGRVTERQQTSRHT